MRKSLKAALLSALVFPGSGHLFLRCYARALVLFAITAAALADFIYRAWLIAEAIQAQLTHEIENGGMIDLPTLVAHATAALDRIDNQPFTLATMVMLICWLIGIVDSYRVGEQRERAAAVPPP